MGLGLFLSYNMYYYRMLLTRHYDQRPFDETVCDAIIANVGVKNRQKMGKMFAMADASNTIIRTVVLKNTVIHAKFTTPGC